MKTPAESAPREVRIDWRAGTVVYDLPSTDYRAIPALSWSSLSPMGSSAALCKWRREQSDAPTAAMILGDATHTAALEPAAFPRRYAIWSGGRRAGNEWKEWLAATLAEGRRPLTEDEASLALAMGSAVRSNEHAMALIREGRPEVSLFWTDAETGVRCKARADWLGPAGLPDVKSCRSAAPRRFAAASWEMGYHGQLAWYRAGVLACHIPEPECCALIAVESKPPHVVQPYRLPLNLLDAGEKTAREYLARWLECEKAGRWLGYFDGLLDLGAPRWADAEQEDEDAEEFGLVSGSAA